MALRAKNRYQAFSFHFLISISIVSFVSYLIFSHWYPEPYFSADGGWSVFRMIIIVDLILGPVLTLIIYKPGKKGLKFDLSAIATVQVIALIYGGSVLYSERPAYLTFSIDRFVLVSADDIDASKIRDPELKEGISEFPQLVFAKMPEDPEENKKFVKEVFAGKPDLEFRPEYYESYSKNINEVISKRKDVAIYKKLSSEHANKIEQFIQKNCMEECAFFPLVGKKKDALLVIGTKDGRVIGGIDIDPWAKAS